MGKSPGAKLFWRMTGPLLLYWLIDFLVRFACEFVVLFPHAVRIMEDTFPAGTASKADLMEWAYRTSEKFIEILMPHQILILTAGALATIPLTVYLFRKDRKTAPEPAPFAKGDKKAEFLKYLKVTGFGVAACTGLNCLLFMAGLAFWGGGGRQTLETLYSAGFLEEVICLGILIPFTEELMYRGILFGRLREIMGFSRAAIFTSILFGFLHANTLQMIYAVIIGLFLACVYEKFGSLKAPVLLHSVVNITSITLTETKGFDYLASNMLIMGFVTVLCAFFGSLMFVSIQQDLKPDLPDISRLK